jgi:hypothetical protein
MTVNKLGTTSRHAFVSWVGWKISHLETAEVLIGLSSMIQNGIIENINSVGLTEMKAHIQAKNIHCNFTW